MEPEIVAVRTDNSLSSIGVSEANDGWVRMAGTEGRIVGAIGSEDGAGGTPPRIVPAPSGSGFCRVLLKTGRTAAAVEDVAETGAVGGKRSSIVGTGPDFWTIGCCG